MNDVEVMLKDGSTWLSTGDHIWVSSGIPDVFRCQCGLIKHSDGSYSAKA